LSWYERVKPYGWTVGSIVFFGLVCFFLISLIISNLQVVLNTIEGQVEEPSNPILHDFYSYVYPIYTYFKAIVTSKYGFAVLVAASLVGMAFEIEWKRRKK